MKQKIETRELLVIDGPRFAIPCTLHRVRSSNSVVEESAERGKRTGVLFLNSLSPTRAARGDSAVGWADALAERGYPSLRIDLPGFGDSEADPPSNLLDFINRGGYTRAASFAIRSFASRCNLSNVVVFGLCAGAVAAIYTVVECKECSGLVLLDPYFHLPESAKVTPLSRLIRCLPPGAIRRGLNRTLTAARSIQPRNVSKHLPPNSNFRLLYRWEAAVSAGKPMIVFGAPSVKQKGVEFDYFGYIRKQIGPQSQIAIHMIEGADHTFASQRAWTAVLENTAEWLRVHFPLYGTDCDQDLTRSVAELKSRLLGEGA